MANLHKVKSVGVVLSGALLLVAVALASAAKAASPDAFERGWAAYDRSDFPGALQIWVPLAEQGHVNAQINLGVMYDYGNGVVQDSARAARWYRSAALQGSAIGQYNLGILLLEGKVPAPADEDAMYWLQQAAQQDNADAQLQLGLIYAENGNGEQRRNPAPKWLYQAAVNYLASGDTDGARTAAAALQNSWPDHRFTRVLQARMIKQANPVARALDAHASSALSTGTAWTIAAGYAVTNHHVVAGKDSIALVDLSGEEFKANVVVSDEINDIALLRVEDPARLPPALPLAPANARLGASVFTIGFPRVDTMGTTPKLSLGIISGESGLRDDPTSYQISVPVQPGNSGGPLLNMRGEVVGLITSMLGAVDAVSGETRSLAGINYALKVDVLEGLLRDAPQQAAIIDELSAAADPLEGLADRVQRSVMIVMAQ